MIDRTGRINTGIANPRIRKNAHFPEFVIAWAKETEIGKDIVITENDIKNLIMSKASVHAACVTLMKEAGVTRHEITTIYFAGAFGNYLDKKNATIIGLIPEIGIDQIKNIGNGAVAGANIALINRRARKTLDEIAYKIAYIELNAESSFMDEYTGSTFLPHTDLTLFPMVQKLLESCRIRKGVSAMAKMIPSPHSLATGVGALPHTDPKQACDDVLAIFPDFPYIPTLPDRSQLESIVFNDSEQLPGRLIRDDRLLFDSTRDQTAAMEKVYMDFVEGNFADYGLHREYASAFIEMMARKIPETQHPEVPGDRTGHLRHAGRGCE